MQSTGSSASHRSGFTSLAVGGLDWNSLPLRLYAKGNSRFWNAADIDLRKDAEDWLALPENMREAFAGLSAMFIAGEEAVTRDLQPFISAMAAEGRFADELYLTQFCFEEARHVEVFRRWLDAVGLTSDLNHLVAENPGHHEIFMLRLPGALSRLLDDPSPANQVRASITYNHVVEGTLALTGYYAWNRFCANLGIFPGMQQIIARIGDDERRHMAWGTYTCRRHVAASPANWDVARECMRELLPHALHQIQFAARRYPPELFGVNLKELLSYAGNRSRRRLRAIESARHVPIELIDTDMVAEELEESIAAGDRRESGWNTGDTTSAGRRGETATAP